MFWHISNSSQLNHYIFFISVYLGHVFIWSVFSELTSRFWLNWIEKLPVLLKLFNRFWCSLIWLFSFLKMWTPFQSWNKAKNILTKKEFSDANVSKPKENEKYWRTESWLNIKCLKTYWLPIKNYNNWLLIFLRCFTSVTDQWGKNPNTFPSDDTDTDATPKQGSDSYLEAFLQSLTQRSGTKQPVD